MATNPEEYINFDDVSPPYPQTGLYPTPHHHNVFPPLSRGRPFPPRAGSGYYRGPYPNPHHHYNQYQQQYWNNQYNPRHYNRGGRRGRGSYRGKRKRTYYEPKESAEGDRWFESVMADPWKDLVTEEEEMVHKQRLSERFSDVPADNFISSTSTIPPSLSVTDPLLNTTESCMAASPVQSLPITTTLPLSPEGELSNICPKREDLSKEPLTRPPCSPDPEIPSQSGGPLTGCEVDSKHFV